MLERIKRAWAVLDLDVRDGFLFVGLALLAVGCGMIYLPAAPIVVGAILVYVALRRPPPPSSQ